MAVDKRFSSIHSRLLFTSLLPLILLCMVLAGYMISSQRVVLLTNLKNIGNVAIQQLSSNAEFALYSNNEEMLRDLGESVLDIPAVEGVTFYNINLKSNSYLSMSLELNQKLNIFLTSYYQTAFKNLSSARIIVDGNLQLKFDEHISYDIHYELQFDQAPVIETAELSYVLKTGLRYTF